MRAPRVGVAHEQIAEAAAAQRVRDREDLGQRGSRAVQQRHLRRADEQFHAIFLRSCFASKTCYVC